MNSQNQYLGISEIMRLIQSVWSNIEPGMLELIAGKMAATRVTSTQVRRIKGVRHRKRVVLGVSGFRERLYSLCLVVKGDMYCRRNSGFSRKGRRETQRVGESKVNAWANPLPTKQVFVRQGGLIAKESRYIGTKARTPKAHCRSHVKRLHIASSIRMGRILGCVLVILRWRFVFVQ